VPASATNPQRDAGPAVGAPSRPAFYAVEGVDGTGKSHLVRSLAQRNVVTGGQPVVVLLKDADNAARTALGTERLAGMHALTWSYPVDEEVWRYSQRYWLYTLLSWYQLYHEMRVLPELERGHVVVADGWFYKHWARFSLSGDDELRSTARQLFLGLPRPDAVFLLDTPVATAAHRLRGTFKPSEAGAFESRRADLGVGDLLSYQQRSATALHQVLSDSGTPVHPVDTTTGDELATVVTSIEQTGVQHR
jgi:thymidylate kinase